MSTPEESLDFDGVLDVSPLIPICFNNPLRSESIEFITEVLRRRRKILLPVSAVIGAYHIATRYLAIPRVAAKKVFGGILESGSSALYPYVTARAATEALDYASSYGIESWDGYLISLAKATGSSILYSLDQELKKVAEVTVVSPFKDASVREYHKFAQSLFKRREKR